MGRTPISWWCALGGFLRGRFPVYFHLGGTNSRRVRPSSNVQWGAAWGAGGGFTSVSTESRCRLTGWEAPGRSGLALLEKGNVGYPNAAQPFPNPLLLFHSPLLSNFEISIRGCILSWLAAMCRLPELLSEGSAVQLSCCKAGDEATGPQHHHG